MADELLGIAGFWKRVWALLIDSILLGVVGAFIIFFAQDYLISLHTAGRIIGFVIAGIYFGFLNSTLGNGQTIGKRRLTQV